MMGVASVTADVENAFMGIPLAAEGQPFNTASSFDLDLRREKSAVYPGEMEASQKRLCSAG